MPMRLSLIPLTLSIILLASCIGGGSNRAPVSAYGVSAGAGSAGVHSVVRGDTLYSISNRYKIAMRDIVIDNNLSAPFTLREGQRLKLPPPKEYRVRNGDSLYTVSRLFGVNTSNVAELNKLQPPFVIRPGQVLRLPSSTRRARPVRVASVAKPGAKPQSKPGERTDAQRGVAKPSSKPDKAGRASPRKSTAQSKTIKQARAKITAKTPKRASSKFKRPVNGRVISSYGPKKNGLHNDGINIKAPKGTAVSAAENGVVVYAGNELKGSGNLILIRHEGRWMTAYAHMDKLNIKRGDVIKRGQVIGTVGSTGSVDTPQLHFEVRRGTEAINPSVYLDG